MRIALLGKHFGWGGGAEFLRHVANGLSVKQEESNLSLLLLLPVENKLENIGDAFRLARRSFIGSLRKRRPWLAMPQHAYSENMHDFFKQVRGNIQVVYHENTAEGLLKCLKKKRADIVLPTNGTMGKEFPVPWVGYVYDFQYKYYPQYFSSRECFDRDNHISSICKDATSLIVNSRSVKNDIQRFYPHSDTEIFNLPFSPCLQSNWLESSPVDLSDRYDLPEKYFLISNQFWIHKDHSTAFKAFALCSRELNFGLVCTGTMNDHRFPDYQEELLSLLKNEGLQSSVKLLGHIPKRDQIEIMKNSVAVVQPTLFEGGPGGGCVYDAVALGVPVILSDIPVNREVDSDNVFYFKAGDVDCLAEAMVEISRLELERPSKEELIKRGDKRLTALSERLMEAVDSVAR